MKLGSQKLRTIVVVAGFTSAGMIMPSMAAETDAQEAPAVSVDELSDDTLFAKLFASRDFCKKLDTANAAGYDKALEALTADSVAEAKAFMAKADYSELVAKSVAEFEARDKDPKEAGFGKGMCENYLKAQ